MKDSVPECIKQIWESTNAEIRISHELLTWVGRTWDVDPMVFVSRKGTPSARQNLDGTYFQQLAEQAERILLKPARVANRLEEHRERLGRPYLYPQVEMTVADVEKWLAKYKCEPSQPDTCRDFSEAFMGSSIRIVCMARNDERAGFPTYRKGTFSGYLEEGSRLGGNDFIPVKGFGMLDVLVSSCPRSLVDACKKGYECPLSGSCVAQ